MPGVDPLEKDKDGNEMTNEAIKLFFSACRFLDQFDEGLLRYMNDEVFGKLLANRTGPITYASLMKNGLSDRIGREYRTVLRTLFESSLSKNKVYLGQVNYIDSILQSTGIPYAPLKGAVLCPEYPEGYRSANDIDILISSKDIDTVSAALLSEGFNQGYLKNGVFREASRAEIVRTRMTRGETVPFFKLTENGYLEVDINFSFDYMSDASHVTERVLNGSGRLGRDDFLIHLCSHLYKEAATLPWIMMGRDMSVYKYVDLYFLLHDTAYPDLFGRARELGLEKECAFAVAETDELLGVPPEMSETASDILQNSDDFLHIVKDPAGHKTYIYTEKDIVKRFFSENRINLLEEITDESLT